MSHAKQPSKRMHRACAVPLLGAAGLSLSLASGAPAATEGPAADMPTQNTGMSHEITLGEEEISDVSLATFYVFDKENPRTLGIQLARGGGCGGGGCGGHGGGCGGGGARQAAAADAPVPGSEAAAADAPVPAVAEAVPTVVAEGATAAAAVAAVSGSGGAAAAAAAAAEAGAVGYGLTWAGFGLANEDASESKNIQHARELRSSREASGCGTRSGSPSAAFSFATGEVLPVADKKGMQASGQGQKSAMPSAAAWATHLRSLRGHQRVPSRQRALDGQCH